MTMPEGMQAATPPEPYLNRKGKQPSLLTDDKVRILLSSPEQWFIISTKDKWISGVKANIESMTQRNIAHLSDKGKFEIQQRRNKTGQIDIYCRFVPNYKEEIL
ncbi:MAG: hypothetical protein CMQ02_08945 [Gammaproteobacteria bacterium]|jgi:hypothetical protein|nr:hypothetical protein [Gammaproteobacteria bacterium]